MSSRSPDREQTTPPPPVDLPTVYEGNQVHLRPVGRDDARVFYDWRADLASFGLLPEAGVHSYEEYVPHWEKMLARTITLVTVAADDGGPIGFVQAYDINVGEGWCFVLSYQVPEARGKTMGIEAATAFWEYLFAQLNVRKIYMDVAEFNTGWLRAFPGADMGVFSEEGRFRGHVLHDGRYWDTIRFAVYRDRFLELRTWVSWFRALRPQPGVDGDGSGPPPALPAGNAAAGPPPASLARRDGSDASPQPRLESVRRFLRYRQLGDVDNLMDLLADDLVYKSPLTAAPDGLGKREYRSLMDFQQRRRSLPGRAPPQPVPIAWQEPEQDAEAVIIRGDAPSGTITLQWVVRSDGKISRHSIDGPPDLVASYLLGAVPPH